MTRRARAFVLLGLAGLLGSLAASDVAGREAALRDQLGPSVPVVVARADIAAGDEIAATRLAVRRVPARYAPAAGYASARGLAGLRAAVAIPAGSDLTPAMVHDGTTAQPGAPRPGERIAELVARGSAELIVPGARVDVLVTRERADGSGETRVALQAAEVVRAAPAPDARGEGESVAVSLRVKLRDAVYLAAAQSFAREIRLLPRAPGDRGRGKDPGAVDERL